MNFHYIESPSNPKIKEWASLKKKKGRLQYQSFLIEGENIVAQSFINNAEVKALLIREDEKEKYEKQFINSGLIDPQRCSHYYILSEKAMRKISSTEHPQGIIAVLELPLEVNQVKILEKINGNSFILTLDRIQDPGNIGTILRTATAAGVEATILIKGCTDPYGEKAIRASMGAIFSMPIIQMDVSEFLNHSMIGKLRHYAADLKDACDYREVSYKEGTNLIIGNEGQGLSEELDPVITKRVKIPIYGPIESLNAGIAAGILLYKVAEERNL